MATVTELMLAIKRWNTVIFYHKDTNTFDGLPFSSIEEEDLDMNAVIPIKDYNNFLLPSYEEINHKDIMSFYVKECVEDKAIRKQLFDILRRHDFVDAFVEALHKLNLYEDFDVVCGDIYNQIFLEWAEKNELKF